MSRIAPAPVLFLLWPGRRKSGCTVCSRTRRCSDFVHSKLSRCACVLGGCFLLAAQSMDRVRMGVFPGRAFASSSILPFFCLGLRCRVNSQICRGEFAVGLAGYAIRKEKRSDSLLHIYVETPGVRLGMYLFMKCCSVGIFVSRFLPARLSFDLQGRTRVHSFRRGPIDAVR